MTGRLFAALAQECLLATPAATTLEEFPWDGSWGRHLLDRMLTQISTQAEDITPKPFTGLLFLGSHPEKSAVSPGSKAAFPRLLCNYFQ